MDKEIQPSLPLYHDDLRAGRHLRNGEKEEILQMKRDGHTNKDIASRFKVSVHTNQRVSVPRPLEREVKQRAKKQRTTESQIVVARTLIEEGYTQAQVASKD